jgi:hypothetical protein
VPHGTVVASPERVVRLAPAANREERLSLRAREGVAARDPGEEQELFDRYLADQVPDPGSFLRIIDAEDEMFLHTLKGYRGRRERAVVTYLVQGREMMEELRQIASWRFGGWPGVSRILDFASGFGRFTRYLVQEVPPPRSGSATSAPMRSRSSASTSESTRCCPMRFRSICAWSRAST